MKQRELIDYCTDDANRCDCCPYDAECDVYFDMYGTTPACEERNHPERYTDEDIRLIDGGLAIRKQPTIQPELTDEQAIAHLQSSGWMQRHDKEMYESGLREQLADDSDSYDSLLPNVQSDLIEKIQVGITATNSNDAYSLGMRNGMRWCRSLIDGVEPKFEGMEGADT